MEFHRVIPTRDLARLWGFLAREDPQDYLLEDLPEWIRDGRLWVGEGEGRWAAFGRLHDLGEGEGWVSGLRVVSAQRGRGVGGQLLEAILGDARVEGLTALRAVIEVGNTPSRRLFERFGFRPVAEMTLRRGLARDGTAPPLHHAEPGEPPDGPVGWCPGRTGRVDLLPGKDGGRFGRWRPSLLGRWVVEEKLYLGPGLAAGVQIDWWRKPRTLWVNPLWGDPADLFPALDRLTRTLGHDEWQAFLPLSDELQREYDALGTLRHPSWGEHVLLYERCA